LSKFFFKGRIDAREKYQRFGYNTNRQVKLGSCELPLTLLVNSEERKQEVSRIVDEHDLFAQIDIDPNTAENIVELTAFLDKPKTQTKVTLPNRNDPCSCGSGKKFKKCCGA
jgi:SWIM/SEC-C metal-binding protein